MDAPANPVDNGRSALAMAEILLTTFNAKFIHAAFGLRYLWANLGELQARADLIEFDIHSSGLEIVEALLARRPRIIGIGVYIWNATLAREVVILLKRLAPDVTVILGGPEVSYEVECQPLAQSADYVITGEADLKFAEVCRALLEGKAPEGRVLAAGLPELGHLTLPYEFYKARDLTERIIYVEASRGCPFTCEFCLSSLDIPVRAFPLERLLAEFEKLLERGLSHFKFVDRTFNLNLKTSSEILNFFLARYRPGLFLHFEMIPDRLPEGLRSLIVQFPRAALQFEVGIQTFNPEVADRIRRRQNYQALEDNLTFLRRDSGVHVHADLIMGLPGETVESFGIGFDRLVALGPQEIQVGILKRLRGTPIVRHDQEWEMVYNPEPPYELLRNCQVSFAEMQRMRRFSRIWDLVANSGNFVETTPLLWADSRSPFASFMRWSEWLYAQEGRQHAIALVRLVELLFRYLTDELQQLPEDVAQHLWRDYQRAGRSDRPIVLRPYLTEPGAPAPPTGGRALLKRQQRHQSQ